MRYGYDMERHFRQVSARTDTGPDTQDSGHPAGRIYLNATPDGARSFRGEPATRRFLQWIKARKPGAKPRRGE